MATKKLFVISDLGIDGAFALALLLNDPAFDVIGISASAGNPSYKQATQNLSVVLHAFDLGRMPRLGAAPEIEYGIDGSDLHGSDGLAELHFPEVNLHQQINGDKLLMELAKMHPNEITTVILGPCTVMARALERFPELPNYLAGTVIVGGAVQAPGETNAVADFHFTCDPEAARTVVQSFDNPFLIPLDVTRKFCMAPSRLDFLRTAPSPVSNFLNQLLPFGIRRACNVLGIEGLPLGDVAAYLFLAAPELFSWEKVDLDVEIKGELTRGMTVIDRRSPPAGVPKPKSD
ncbi:MAG: nucleoside hydrolase [Zavarzinella sp.]